MAGLDKVKSAVARFRVDHPGSARARFPEDLRSMVVELSHEMGTSKTAKALNISKSAVDRWRRESGDSSTSTKKPSRFVAVRVGAPAIPVMSSAVGVRITLPDGTRIESQDGDMSSLATLATMMRGRSAP